MSKKWSPEKLRLLQRCLGDGPYRRTRFKAALVNAMKKRDVVCVKCVAEETAEHLGEKYGIWTEEILLAAAKETFIELNCLKGIHNA